MGEMIGTTSAVESGAVSVLPIMTQLFEHSITWEDDLWRADPCDVDSVHVAARRKFLDLLLDINKGRAKPARILLFQGQSGAGKTHLIRALRTYAHHYGLGYVGYAQMSSEVTSYADFFLRRLVNSLEKSYDPFTRGESALRRLSDHMAKDAELVGEQQLVQLREDPLDDAALARLVLAMSDAIVASPRFAGQDLDINIVRALLYMQRNDPRIDGRIRQFLYGRPLNELSQSAVGALDANAGEDRAFEIIEGLGRLMWVVDRAALVFCIDQVEDLRSLGDPEERFEKAIRDLIQITNRVPTAIAIVSSLEDFYRSVRERLPCSFIDRIEKAGPVQLSEARSAEEAKLIIEKRIAQAADTDEALPLDTVTSLFGPDFFSELRGLSPRRLLEAVQLRLTGGEDDGRGASNGSGPPSHAATAVTPASMPSLSPADMQAANAIKERWERFNLDFTADVPIDEVELVAILTSALRLAQEESASAVRVTVMPGDWGDEAPGADVAIQHTGGAAYENRLFVCNRGSHGGALTRQLDRATQMAAGRNPIALRASEFPAAGKSGTGQSLRAFQQAGGRRIVVAPNEWERMIALNEFQIRHRQEPGFAAWLVLRRRNSMSRSSAPAR